jgi:Spy/CpxP family protein refolding chaperone
MKSLTKKLKLTEEQKAQIESILVEKHKRLETTMIMKDSNARVRALLTEEQLKKFDKLGNRQRHRDGTARRPSGRSAAGRPPAGRSHVLSKEFQARTAISITKERSSPK